MFSRIIKKKCLVFVKDGQLIKLILRCEDQDTASRPLMNVSNKHRTSQCYGSRPRSAERGNLAWRGLGLRNRHAAEGVHKGCAQWVCTEVRLFICLFALLWLNFILFSLSITFFKSFVDFPFIMYVRCVCVGGYLCVDAGSQGDQKHGLTWKLEL